MTTLPARPTQVPPGRLPVPRDFVHGVQGAMRSGIADARTFAREHVGDPAAVRLVPQWALLQMDWPPSGDEERGELRELYAIAARRNPQGIAIARWYAEHGLTDGWEAYLDEYRRRVGPRQAMAAARLLHDTLMEVNQVTQVAKAAAARRRPFVVDPKLPLAIERPGNNPSYPSGHTTAAFAAAIVLGRLMPDRRGEFLDVAMQASYARLYGGVHFPSDVLAGVRMATTIASDAVRRAQHVPPVSGTGGQGATAGRRRVAA